MIYKGIEIVWGLPTEPIRDIVGYNQQTDSIWYSNTGPAELHRAWFSILGHRFEKIYILTGTIEQCKIEPQMWINCPWTFHKRAWRKCLVPMGEKIQNYCSGVLWRHSKWYRQNKTV